MPFVLKKGSSYTWPVTVSSPIDGGKYEKQTFDAEFKRIPESKLKALLNDENTTDAGFAREVLVGWKGIKDESNTDIPFSEMALNEILDTPGVANAIVRAYTEGISGSKVKN